MLRWLCLISLLAYSSLSARAASDEYANVHNIAIISAIGSTVHVQKVGATIFGAVNFDLGLDRNLDAEIVKLAKVSLTDSRFTVVDVSPDIFPIPKSGNLDLSDIKKLIRGMPKPEGVDAYAIFVTNYDAPFYVRGYALNYSVNFGLHEPDSLLAISYRVLVVNAATGSEIDIGIGRRPSRESIVGHAIPMAVCGKDVWAEKPESYTLEQKQGLERKYSALLASSVAYTLADAELITKAQAEKATANFETQQDASCRMSPN